MISVVIPVYNEEKNVGELHRQLMAVLKGLGQPFEIIFVDDGSADGTLAELKKLSPVKVISFVKNLRKSYALVAGFAEARGDYIITMDGDLQDDPAEIPKFIEAIKTSDLVCGWKVNRLDPLGKRLASKIANWAARAFAGSQVHDMGCCFKIYRKNVAKSLDIHADMHQFIPPIVSSMGFKVDEIMVNHRKRYHGDSKWGSARLLRSAFTFAALLFVNKFASRPMQFFGFLGGILSAAGFLILLYLSYIRLFEGVFIGNRPLLFLGILLVLVGLQFAAVGLLGELIIRQKSGDGRPFLIKEKFER